MDFWRFYRKSVPTEKDSPDKSSPEKVLQKRFMLRVSEELKEAKFRTEALMQKGFLKYSQQFFCTCIFSWHLIWRYKKNFHKLLWSHFWKNYVQSEQKGRKRNIVVFTRRICTGFSYFGERRKEKDIILASGQEYVYIMQRVSVRLDIKMFTMLLVYYKTILAFSTANF